MTNGKLVWLNFENIDALLTLTKSFDVKSPNNVVSILVDLAQKTKVIQLKQMRHCPTCDKEFEIEENTSRAYKLKDHIRHCDLEDTVCKQICKIQHRVKLESNDKPNGTTTTKDETSDAIDTTEESGDIQLGYRNGVRITDMDDPNYDHKFFDIDLPNLKKKLEEEKNISLQQ